MDWKAEWQPGVIADSPALIPLVGNNSRLINYSNAKSYTYTNLMAVGFHLPLSLFGFLSIHIPIYYLFTIILTDYSNRKELKIIFIKFSTCFCLFIFPFTY